MTPRRAAIAIFLIAVAAALGFELRDIEAALINRKLKRLGDPKKMDTNAIELVTSAITYAKDNNLPADPNDISSAGMSFLDLGPARPKAWEAAQSYLAYRTTFNRDLTAVQSAQEIATTQVDPKLLSEQQSYTIHAPDGFPLPTRLSFGGNVPAERAAQMNLFGQENENANATRHDEVLLIDGGGFYIDHIVMKHVIFRDSTIIYQGDPVVMEDVIFVNCTFLLNNAPSAIAFARQVFTNTAINFKVPSEWSLSVDHSPERV